MTALDLIEINGSRLSRRDAERRQQPHWLYRMFDAEGTLLYVGQTSNPVQRFTLWFSHLRGDLPAYRWFAGVARVDWQRYADWWEATAAEKHVIETERPLHNRYHQPKRVA